MKKQIKHKSMVAIIAAALLAACSSGGSSSSPAATVSGVAAAGAPLTGQVRLKDSAGAELGPVATAVDGGFSFDVRGLQPPFYLKAEGAVTNTSYVMYSAAMTAGTANINPLTSVIVAAAAGVTDPALAYFDPAAHPVGQTSMDKAVRDIKSLLQPLLTDYNADVNPLTAPFAADHTGLDAVMDAVAVSISPADGSVSVVNRMNGAVVARAMAATLATPADPLVSGEYPAAAAIGDIQEIQAMFGQLTAVLNKGGSNTLTSADLDPFFASAFGIYDGLDRAGTIAKWVADFNNWSKTYVTMNISVDVYGPDYRVQTISYFSDGSYYDLWPDGLIVTKEGEVWKLKGNGHKSHQLVAVETHKWVYADGSESIKSGIDFYMPILGGQDLQRAVISGPGIAGSIEMQSQSDGKGGYRFVFAVPDVPGRQEFYSFTDRMSDAQIGAIPDNAVYSISYYDSLDNLTDTRDVTVPKRPFTMAEAGSGDIYPAVPGLTSHFLADAQIGGAFTFAFTKSPAYLTIWMTTAMSYSSAAARGGSGDYQMPLDSTSVTLANPPLAGAEPANDAWLMLNATDQWQRSPYLWWEFKLPTLAHFETHRSDRFLVDIETINDGHPFKGRRAIIPHQGAHVHWDNLTNQWPQGGTAPGNYPAVYAVADGYIDRVDYSFPLESHDRYGVDLAFAKEGSTVYVFSYAIEPMVPEPSLDFYKPFILVSPGQYVKKGDVIAYMYLPPNSAIGSHIHFHVQAKDTNNFIAPAIFAENIVDSFVARWNVFRYDDWISRTYPMPSCMGYMLDGDENPFGNVAADVLK